MSGVGPGAVEGDDVYVHRSAHMGTVVSITVVGGRGSGAGDGTPRAEHRAHEPEHRVLTVGRAIAWFEHVERICTRFDPRSELSQLTARAGASKPVSAVLFQALTFAMAVAEETRGAFDPTVGSLMESRGFNVDYRTGRALPPIDGEPSRVWYRDVELDPKKHTATVLRALTLDLGAVAKGLAVDLAMRELHEYPNVCVEAGGDGYVRGSNGRDDHWTVGIRHPRDPSALLATLRVSNVAVCTSGDYERPAAEGVAGHHIVDPRTGESPKQVASVTVIAPTTMLADGLGTAAFVLGPTDGLELLKAHGVEGLIVTPELARFTTPGWDRASVVRGRGTPNSDAR